MIGPSSVDHHTVTVDGAANFERLRGGSYASADVDLPGPHDLVDDERAQQRQRDLDAAARARGEYVPSAAMRTAAAACSMSLVQRGVLDMDVQAAREGVLALRPRYESVTRPSDVVEALNAVYGDDAEVALHNGAIWVRIIRSAFADPFMVDGVVNDAPPF